MCISWTRKGLISFVHGVTMKIVCMSVNIVFLGVYSRNRIGNVPLGVRDDTSARLGKQMDAHLELIYSTAQQKIFSCRYINSFIPRCKCELEGLYSCLCVHVFLVCECMQPRYVMGLGI